MLENHVSPLWDTAPPYLQLRKIGFSWSSRRKRKGHDPLWARPPKARAGRNVNEEPKFAGGCVSYGTPNRRCLSISSTWLHCNTVHVSLYIPVSCCTIWLYINHPHFMGWWWWCASQTQGPWNIHFMFSCFFPWVNFFLLWKHPRCIPYESDTSDIYIEHLAPRMPPGPQEASIRRKIAERMARQILEVKKDNIDETDVSCILNLGQMFGSMVSWRVVMDPVEIPPKIGRIDPLIMVDCPTSHVRLPNGSWTFERCLVVVRQLSVASDCSEKVGLLDIQQ